MVIHFFNFIDIEKINFQDDHVYTKTFSDYYIKNKKISQSITIKLNSEEEKNKVINQLMSSRTVLKKKIKEQQDEIEELKQAIYYIPLSSNKKEGGDGFQKAKHEFNKLKS